MEPEDSLPCVQEPATDTCPESDEFSVHSHILFIVKSVVIHYIDWATPIYCTGLYLRF